MFVIFWLPQLCFYCNPVSVLQYWTRYSQTSDSAPVSQRRQKKTEPRPQGICTTNLVKIGQAVPETCSRTDTHTQTNRHRDRQTDRNTPLSYRGGVINNDLEMDLDLRYRIAVGSYCRNGVVWTAYLLIVCPTLIMSTVAVSGRRHSYIMSGMWFP